MTEDVSDGSCRNKCQDHVRAISELIAAFDPMNEGADPTPMAEGVAVAIGHDDVSHDAKIALVNDYEQKLANWNGPLPMHHWAVCQWWFENYLKSRPFKEWNEGERKVWAVSLTNQLASSRPEMHFPDICEYIVRTICTKTTPTNAERELVKRYLEQATVGACSQHWKICRWWYRRQLSRVPSETWSPADLAIISAWIDSGICAGNRPATRWTTNERNAVGKWLDRAVLHSNLVAMLQAYEKELLSQWLAGIARWTSCQDLIEPLAAGPLDASKRAVALGWLRSSTEAPSTIWTIAERLLAVQALQVQPLRTIRLHADQPIELPTWNTDHKELVTEWLTRFVFNRRGVHWLAEEKLLTVQWLIECRLKDVLIAARKQNDPLTLYYAASDFLRRSIDRFDPEYSAGERTIPASDALLRYFVRMLQRVEPRIDRLTVGEGPAEAPRRPPEPIVRRQVVPPELNHRFIISLGEMDSDRRYAILRTMWRDGHDVPGAVESLVPSPAANPGTVRQWANRARWRLKLRMTSCGFNEDERKALKFRSLESTWTGPALETAQRRGSASLDSSELAILGLHVIHELPPGQISTDHGYPEAMVHRVLALHTRQPKGFELDHAGLIHHVKVEGRPLNHNAAHFHRNAAKIREIESNCGCWLSEPDAHLINKYHIEQRSWFDIARELGMVGPDLAQVPAGEIRSALKIIREKAANNQSFSLIDALLAVKRELDERVVDLEAKLSYVLLKIGVLL